MTQLERSIGGKNFSFSELNQENINAMHYSLENSEHHGGIELLRDADTSSLNAAEAIYDTYLNKLDDIDNRDDAYGRFKKNAIQNVNQSIEKLWSKSSNIFGGNDSGKYPRTRKGKSSFCSDLMTLYTNELTSYYLARGLSEEDAHMKASTVAQWLTAQDALETAYGNSIIGDYNYGNIKKGSSWNGKTKKDSTYHEDWRSYDAPEQYIKDKIALLSRKRYGDALMSNSFEEFTARLQGGGYSSSDTAEVYHQKVLGTLNSVTQRIEESENWVDLNFDKNNAVDQDQDNNSGKIQTLKIGNHIVRVDKSVWNSTNDPEKALQNVHVQTPNGSVQRFESYYRDLSTMERDVLKEDIKKEASREIMYTINPKMDYSGRGSGNDINSEPIFLGYFDDTNNFSQKARNQLTYHNQYNSSKNGAWIGYYVYLTKDLKNWKRIETNCEFYMENPSLGGQAFNSGKILYDKDRGFPDWMYEVTGKEKDRSMMNPIMSVLFVNLTPNAFLALKELLELANKNIQIRNNQIELETETGEWRTATSNEIISLKKFGLVEYTDQDLNGMSGFNLTPKYEVLSNNRDMATRNFEVGKNIYPLINGSSWRVSSYADVIKPIASEIQNTGKNAITSANNWFKGTAFGAGYIAGKNGQTIGSNTEQNSSQEAPVTIVSDGGTTYYNDNRQHNTIIYSSANPESLVNQ